MNKEELSRLSIEILELCRKVKIYFKTPESLQENISQLNELEQRLIRINKKLQAQDSSINKIISSIKYAAENITFTSLNTVKSTAKFGLAGVAIATKFSGFVGSKIVGNAIPINILSQIAEFTIENSADILGGKIENISEQIKIISEEQRIPEKEAIKQLTITLSVKIEQLIFQCNNFKEFINKCINDNLLFQKITTPIFPKLETIEKEFEQLNQEIKLDLQIKEIELIEKQFNQIENAQLRLVQIEKALLDIVESFRTNTNGCIIFDSEAMENLLVMLNQEIIYIRICPNKGIALCLTGREETIKDIDNRFIQLHKNVEKLIPEANRRYEKAKNMLCKANQKKQASTTEPRAKHNSKQELTKSGKEIHKSKSNSVIPILIGLIAFSFGGLVGWNLFKSKLCEHLNIGSCTDVEIQLKSE